MHTSNTDEELEKGYLPVQVKATEMVRRISNEAAIAVTISRRAIEGWLDDVSPVLLVLYDASTEVAYFLLVKNTHVVQQVAKSSGTTVTLRIAVSDILNASTVKTLHQHKNRVFGE